MANNTCASTLKACATRTLQLDSSGALDPGATNLYVTDALILINFTGNTPDRENFQQQNGCGDDCAVFNGAPKAVQDADLNLTLCKLDAEFIQKLAGGTLITEDYDTIGYLAAEDATTNANGVALEVWTYAWAGRQRLLVNGNPGFWRFVFPKTTWTVGQIQLENAIATIPLVGLAEPNSEFGTGLAADPVPVTVGSAPYGWFLTDEIPTAECGSSALAA